MFEFIVAATLIFMAISLAEIAHELAKMNDQIDEDDS